MTTAGPIFHIKLVGPPGPTGSTGSGGSSAYMHTQASASSTWTINHNLGYRPTICQTTTLGYVEVEGSVQHLSVNQTVVTFNSPIAGYARLV